LFVFSFFALFAPSRSLRLVDAPNRLSVVTERPRQSAAARGYAAGFRRAGGAAEGVHSRRSAFMRI
jgi:hypothetical protein